jgi:hypothetical protein
VRLQQQLYRQLYTACHVCCHVVVVVVVVRTASYNSFGGGGTAGGELCESSCDGRRAHSRPISRSCVRAACTSRWLRTPERGHWRMLTYMPGAASNAELGRHRVRGRFGDTRRRRAQADCGRRRFRFLWRWTCPIYFFKRSARMYDCVNGCWYGEGGTAGPLRPPPVTRVHFTLYSLAERNGPVGRACGGRMR